MTNSNKLADALREMLETYEYPWSQNRPSWLNAVNQYLAEHDAQPAQGKWQPIETAPKDNKRPLMLARFNEAGQLTQFDYNATWESESESWEIPQLYYYWASENGNVEEPTHWMYQPDCFAVAAPQPAPAPVQVDGVIGRFGHHPDPATDFEVEVESLQGRLFDAKHAIPGKHGVTESVAQVADAIKRAMTFRVGGVETSVRAKSILRALELEAAHPPAPAADGAGELLRMVATNIRSNLYSLPSIASDWVYKIDAAIAALRQPVPDAVRELIDADREYDAANEAWDAIPGPPDGCVDDRDFDSPEYQRLCAAIARRSAALAALASQQESRNAE